MSTKKYVSLSKLSTFLDNLKNTFALKNHTHTVDSALSDTSENPVQNKVINAEFDAIAEGMNALELAIDGLADGTTPVSKSESATNAETAETANKATQDASGNIITETYETKTDSTAKLTEAKGYTDQEIAKIEETLESIGDNIDLSSAELITVADIDAICGTTIQNAREVTF